MADVYLFGSQPDPHDIILRPTGAVGPSVVNVDGSLTPAGTTDVNRIVLPPIHIPAPGGAPSHVWRNPPPREPWWRGPALAATDIGGFAAPAGAVRVALLSGPHRRRDEELLVLAF